jgi:hypothetical protein
MEEKIFTFEKEQIIIELFCNLLYQGFITKKYIEHYLKNKGCMVYTEVFYLIPYKNLLFETGGAYREKI